MSPVADSLSLSSCAILILISDAKVRINKKKTKQLFKKIFANLHLNVTSIFNLLYINVLDSDVMLKITSL